MDIKTLPPTFRADDARRALEMTGLDAADGLASAFPWRHSLQGDSYWRAAYADLIAGRALRDEPRRILAQMVHDYDRAAGDLFRREGLRPAGEAIDRVVDRLTPAPDAPAPPLSADAQALHRALHMPQMMAGNGRFDATRYMPGDDD